MAEALLRHHAGDRFEALSAGMEPKGVNPLTIRVLKEKDIDTAGLESKDTMNRLAVFRAVRDEIDARIRAWVASIAVPAGG